MSKTARRSIGAQGEPQRTPSLYTSQDLSGDDFFDLEKLEKEIDDLNKQFNEMQFSWQNVISFNSNCSILSLGNFWYRKSFTNIPDLFGFYSVYFGSYIYLWTYL